jgi:copper chaperone NosL
MQNLIKSSSISTLSRILSILCGISVIAVVFLPIWRIELDAPQYPEGLSMQIFSNKLSGDVEIINGLNHYIGMRTLHADDFIEFTVLPYVIGIIGLFGVIAGIIRKRWFFFTWVTIFLVFAVLTMIDFYVWEYNYGHNLDPTAPIQVPGMTYTPPLIGFKQLLNFGAFSIPDIGGWIMITVGGILTTLGLYEIKRKKHV